MKYKMKYNNKCALATDYREFEKRQDLWLEEREKMGNLYHAFSEYLRFLENRLELENDFYERCLIEEKIKRLKKEMKKYHVTSILAMTKYDLETAGVSSEHQKKSFFGRVKKRVINRKQSM